MCPGALCACRGERGRGRGEHGRGRGAGTGAGADIIKDAPFGDEIGHPTIAAGVITNTARVTMAANYSHGNQLLGCRRRARVPPLQVHVARVQDYQKPTGCTVDSGIDRVDHAMLSVNQCHDPRRARLYTRLVQPAEGTRKVPRVITERYRDTEDNIGQAC